MCRDLYITGPLGDYIDQLNSHFHSSWAESWGQFFGGEYIMHITQKIPLTHTCRLIARLTVQMSVLTLVSQWTIFCEDADVFPRLLGVHSLSFDCPQRRGDTSASLTENSAVWTDVTARFRLVQKHLFTFIGSFIGLYRKFKAALTCLWLVSVKASMNGWWLGVAVDYSLRKAARCNVTTFRCILLKKRRGIAHK